MKLVIDLPDEVVKWFKEKGFIPIGQYLAVDEAMKKAEPLSEVLAEIKAEITKGQAYSSITYISNVIEIIDKHIGKAEREDI